MTVTEIMQQAESLSPQERRELIRLLHESINQPDDIKQHSILELAGMGAEIWEGIDPQEYVNQLRSEWDDRS